jgi:hypothetical protein
MRPVAYVHVPIGWLRYRAYAPTKPMEPLVKSEKNLTGVEATFDPLEEY